MTTSPERGGRKVITDGNHTSEVLKILANEIRYQSSLDSIHQRACQIVQKSVDPIAGPPDHPSDGLLFGLIQSGKTSIITVAAAMAADNGFNCIIILTSDIDLLYDQTLERLSQALRGLKVLGKNDWRDPDRFQRYLRTPPLVIVCSKNGGKLNGLFQAFQAVRARGLSALIIDDEADQASLNTNTSRGGVVQVSRINEAISNLRNFFQVNTYLQVTATPQALFLQRPDHRYRPSFTILSEPGPGYIGGEHFFGDGDNGLLREVDLNEVDLLKATHQPAPTAEVPSGLRSALMAFLVGATARIIKNETGEPGCYAFLCHVSVSKRDHEHIVRLLDRFKEEAIGDLASSSSSGSNRKLIKELQAAYDDLSQTEPNLPSFQEIVEKIKFYLPGTNVKLINAETNEEIKLDGAYNVFVGGNKLGRGVTIKNLLVSYYGRNPRRPNADTVLQHARMYGYREKDLGVTRLFLPQRLADHFRLIHLMEIGLRDLVESHPEGNFEGLYISAPLQATRRNVLDPMSIGMYVAGSSYNPAYPLRTPAVLETTRWIDAKLSDFGDRDDGREVTVDLVIELLEKCKADPEQGTELWDNKTLKAALLQIKTLYGDRAYLVVRRGRGLNTVRRETRGILDSGEERLAPRDAPTLFLYRQNSNAKGEVEVWWPQLRFPEGNYVMAFSFNR